jgi:GxxExxY protein
MNTDETQIAASKDYALEPVTRQIIGGTFEVHNVLGYGFLERVYQRAMHAELKSRGVKVEMEPKITVRFKGNVVGDYAADLLVEDLIIVELKTDTVYQAVHEAQLLNELRGSQRKLGYLINFGRERVEYKRMIF